MSLGEPCHQRLDDGGDRHGIGHGGLCVRDAELERAIGRVRAELPIVGELGERDQVLVAAWLTGLRSPRTRRAYAGDMAAWLCWLMT